MVEFADFIMNVRAFVTTAPGIIVMLVFVALIIYALKMRSFKARPPSTEMSAEEQLAMLKRRLDEGGDIPPKRPNPPYSGRPPIPPEAMRAFEEPEFEEEPAGRRVKTPKTFAEFLMYLAERGQLKMSFKGTLKGKTGDSFDEIPIEGEIEGETKFSTSEEETLPFERYEEEEE